MGNARNIAVIGGGLMGHGIGVIMARAGHNVAISDPIQDTRLSLLSRMTESLKVIGVADDELPSIIGCVSVHETLREAAFNADIVFEAAPEKLELKRSIFSELESCVPDHCILASNTSVIQISKIMSDLESRQRAVGTHWWNPAHMIPLVEIVKTPWTQQSIADDMFALLAEAGKTPVMVEKDVPGFIGNRLQHALWREAISLVENGICDAKAVDTVIKSSFGRRLAVLGPLENADLVGTDLSLDIHENVLFDLESRKGPSPYLEQLVKQGKLGMKSGEGFQKWTEEEAQQVRERVNDHLNKLESILPK